MLLKCPKCFKELIRQDNCYSCPDGHHYDIARQGYVNLVLANQKHSQQPGDDVQSLEARKKFLSRGYYRPLADQLVRIIDEYMHDGESMLDAGCGTGYYLAHVSENAARELEYYAVDISKKGVSMCSRLNPHAICFVGNVFHLPLADGSLDGLMSVFCPYSSEEFGRVIKTGGIVISVTPGARHLYEMKQVVYDEAYLNDEKGYDLPDFTLIDSVKVTYEVNLETAEDIQTLWRMTPYFHTTYLGNSEKLFSCDGMLTTCDFLVNVYRRG